MSNLKLKELLAHAATVAELKEHEVAEQPLSPEKNKSNSQESSGKTKGGVQKQSNNEIPIQSEGANKSSKNSSAPTGTQTKRTVEKVAPKKKTRAAAVSNKCRYKCICLTKLFIFSCCVQFIYFYASIHRTIYL